MYFRAEIQLFLVVGVHFSFDMPIFATLLQFICNSWLRVYIFLASSPDETKIPDHVYSFVSSTVLVSYLLVSKVQNETKFFSFDYKAEVQFLVDMIHFSC